MTVRRRQELYLDAIEESVAMVELAYQRLFAATVLHASDNKLGKTDTKRVTTEMLSQSWLVVDATNRLRVCVESMPGLRRSPAVESVLRASDPVLPLRNYIQHLDSEAPRLALSGRPLWGPSATSSCAASKARKLSSGNLLVRAGSARRRAG
jgi:hypothetical protein